MKPLRLTAAISLRAAGHRNGKPRRFSIVAYNGGKMQPDGFDGEDVVIDLAGLEASVGVPIILDHVQTTETTLGSVDRVQNDGKQLVLAGPVTGQSAQVKNVLAAADVGQQWSASVGVACTDFYDVPAGQVITINGQQHRGPFVHVRRGKLIETSVLPAGADTTTQVNLAAKAAQGVKAMELTFEEFVKQEFDVDVASLTPELIALLQERYDALKNGAVDSAPAVAAGAVVGLRAGAAAESRRIASVQTIAAQHPQILTAAISNGWTPDQTELHVLRANARTTSPDNSRRSTGTSMDTDSERKILSASLMLRCSNEKLALKAYGERTVEAARRQRVTNLVDLAGASLRASGHDPGSYSNRDQMLRAAFSTQSLPNILADTVGRTLVEAYEESTSDWRKFCYVASAEDFRTQTGIRPAAIASLDEYADGGKISHGVILEEATYTWSVRTFAKMLAITRKTIVNDDLGFVNELSPMMGQAAGRSLLDLIWATIMAGEANNFFSVANGNLVSSSSLLAVASLGAAVAAMKSQTDSQGNSIGITPAALAVPPGLELTARGLLNSALLAGSTTADVLLPSGNPVSGLVPNLVIEPRLANATFTGNSPIDWYAFGGPNSRPITVGFLQNAQQPTVEVDDAPFDELGSQLRVVFDYGCALSNPKAAFKSNAA